MAKKELPKAPMPFDRINYIWMIAGVLVIMLGFIIMSLDKEDYGFGFFGITLGPLTILAGFVIEFFAIFKKADKSS